MTVDTFDSSASSTDGELDDLQRLIRKVEAERPGVREHREDMKTLHSILDDLVRLRNEAGLSQKQVATRMGVKQPTISQFETESSDPKVSTLQRYARAVGSCLRMGLGPTEIWTMTTVPYGTESLEVMCSSSGVLAMKMAGQAHAYVEVKSVEASASTYARFWLSHQLATPLPSAQKSEVRAAADSNRADFALAV